MLPDVGRADRLVGLSGKAGQGGPVIAFLGEYDALPGLSQVAGIAEPRPIEAGGNGHGCGHNLLGAAALLTYIKVAEEREMVARFGAEYLTYRRRVPFIIPRLRRSR